MKLSVGFSAGARPSSSRPLTSGSHRPAPACEWQGTHGTLQQVKLLATSGTNRDTDSQGTPVAGFGLQPAAACRPASSCCANTECPGTWRHLETCPWQRSPPASPQTAKAALYPTVLQCMRRHPYLGGASRRRRHGKHALLIVCVQHRTLETGQGRRTPQSRTELTPSAPASTRPLSCTQGHSSATAAVIDLDGGRQCANKVMDGTDVHAVCMITILQDSGV